MLKLTSLITSTAMLAAMTLAAAPSLAQERYRGRRNPAGQESSGQRVERAQPRSETPRTQGAAPRVESRQETPREQPQRQAETPRAQRQEAPRAQPQRQAEAPRANNRGADSRQYDNRGANNRQYDNRRADNRRNDIGRAVPRGRYAPRYEPRYSTRGYGSRSYYRPYVFRPRFSIGFGIFAGYPVPYSYSYPYPIGVYGYGAPRSRVMITPGSSYYGGVALEITPYDADVFVDGQYAGRVEDFDGTTQPLTLTAGTHRIEVQAQGYEPLAVDVGVQAGQVIPYRGDLRPY